MERKEENLALPVPENQYNALLAETKLRCETMCRKVAAASEPWSALGRMTFTERSQLFVACLHLLSAISHLRTSDYYFGQRDTDQQAVICAYFLAVMATDLQLLVTLLTYPERLPERMSLWLAVQWLSLFSFLFLTAVVGCDGFTCVPGVPRAAVHVLTTALPDYAARLVRPAASAAVTLAYTYVLCQNTRLDFEMTTTPAAGEGPFAAFFHAMAELAEHGHEEPYVQVHIVDLREGANAI